MAAEPVYDTKEDSMLVLMIEPGEAPRRLELDHSLGAMQEAVGGLIQILYRLTSLWLWYATRRGSC